MSVSLAQTNETDKYAQLSSSCLTSTQSHGSLTWPRCSKIPQGVNPRGHIRRRFATLSNGDAARRSAAMTTALGQEDVHTPLHTELGDSQTQSPVWGETAKPLLHVYEQGLLNSQAGTAPSGYSHVEPDAVICLRAGRVVTFPCQGVVVYGLVEGSGLRLQTSPG